MPLDLRTIYVVGAVVYLFLGVLQLLAYLTGRFERWPLWWGASSLLLGLGTFALALQTLIPDVIAIDLGNAATVVGYMLLLVAVRVFSGEPVKSWRCTLVVVVAVLPVMLFFHQPSQYGSRIAYLSLFLGFWDLAVAREGVRLARREKLASAWILVGLFVPTAVLYGLRSVLAMTGGLGSGTGLFSLSSGPHIWMAVVAAAIICLRGITLVMMAAERTRNTLIRLVRTDPLTGALNRSGLDAAFSSLPEAKALCALVVDIDHFKTLNDSHGHAVGDRVLQLFVAVARAHIRADDSVIRLGGDEFVILLPETGLSDAVVVADRIHNAFQTSVQADIAADIGATLSIGAAESAAEDDSLTALLQRADEAVYRSKRGGRDRVEVSEAGRRAA